MKHERIYLNDSDLRVYIDTYVANSENCRDAILVIPGGGYGNVCTDREGEPIALEFFSRGYNAFVLGYRVGKYEDKYPDQLVDAGSAMIYIKEHAAELKINPERVFAMGFSAGGHLCGCLATMFNYPEVKEAFGDKHMMIKPKGVVLSYPVTIARPNTHVGSFKNLLKKPLEEYTEEEIRKLSLDTAVTSESSPMFVWHTAEDAVVPVEGSLRLGLALSAAKVPYRLAIYPYGPHGVALANEITAGNNPAFIQPIAEAWCEQADEWIKTL
ncbi:MAG: alpha/beta hydrolase [Clostridia bacterium]|nr:alpha/beta hydrolase [Clostridia bacterium]